MTGTINGETLNRGNSLWYRINYNGQEAYIWSGLVSNTLPTQVIPTQRPPRPIIVPTSAPVYVEPNVSQNQQSNTSYDPNGPDRDCGDFQTHAEAQAFFLAAGGPGRDPHRLDGDHDGSACEALP
ncbi:MAG: excalibur calcium-binding domain-containing protein [Chloroflexota bacterium]